METFDLRFVLLSVFTITIASDWARVLFELTVNLRHRRRRSETIILDPSEVVVVIPCHDSEDSIEETVRSLPYGYTVYCVANNCSDTTLATLRSLQETQRDIVVFEVEFSGKSKSKAAILGAVRARHAGYTHLLLVDDDVLWPADKAIEVLDRAAAVTALPLLPFRAKTTLEGLQALEYIGSSLNKRCQAFFANDVTYAAGAAAIYQCDTYLEVMRLHDGLFAGEDIQCSYLHHLLGYRIDFLPEAIVETEVPNGLEEWWQQRANSWDISFMFLHLDLLLRVLFSHPSRGPGWWIRLLTFYRIYDALMVFPRLALPLILLYLPVLLPVFLISGYSQIGMQYLLYPKLFVPLHEQWKSASRRSMWRALLMFPFYQLLTVVSRLTAFPKSVLLRLRGGEQLDAFVTRNFDACSVSRVYFADGRTAALRRSV